MVFGLQNLTNKSRHKEILKHLLGNDCIKKVEGPPNWVNPIIVLPISNDSIIIFFRYVTLREQYPYSKFFWSAFSPYAGKYRPENSD